MIELLNQLLLVLVVLACFDAELDLETLAELVLEVLRGTETLEVTTSHHYSHLSG